MPENKLLKSLNFCSFTLTSIVILVAPWLFGSWEMWWFWSMAALLFTSTAFFALWIIITPAAETKPLNRKILIPLLSFVPFLVYAFTRACLSDVYMDAERSFLMFFLPFILGIQIMFGFTDKQRRLLWRLILVDLFLLGTYGIINHFVTNNMKVLFADGYEQYYKDNRATGTYFCPDHFSGIMELAICMCVGVIMTRKKAWSRKIFPAILSVVALIGIILSKSRGGGLSIILVSIACIIWGFSQWRPAKAWYYRSIALTFTILTLLLLGAIVRQYDVPGLTGYIERFSTYFGWEHNRDKPRDEIIADLSVRLRQTSRGNMMSGAYDAWKTSPVFGIGAGMHQNLWPHFSTSQDGDRNTGKRPTYSWTTRHSYEAHNDWLQLLEEYGIVGFILFIIPLTIVFTCLLRLRRETHAAALGAVLAIVCMGFHSLGDFNLQMPATTWLLTAIIAVPFGRMSKMEEETSADYHKTTRTINQ